MNRLTIIVIAFGLAMDTFAVSITSGFTIKKLKVSHALRIALFFGGFQAVMPVIGWLAGLGLRSFIAQWDHWIAFGLLTFIGGKMIYESFKLESEKTPVNPLDFFVLLLLSLATSIDALALGVTFAFLNTSVVSPIVIIGLVTFATSFLGVYIGDKFGHFFESKIELVGGLVLVAIGVKILLEHLL